MVEVTGTDPSIYTVGGTVQANDRGLYIPRNADAELLHLCRESTFAYVLTPRQMGKSSLMIRTAERLIDNGGRVVIIDLTQVGTQVSAAEWYRGVLTLMMDQLVLTTNITKWWEAQSHLGVTQRLTQFFQQVVLREVQSPIVIFVDEIDTTLSLDFTDDFFAAIRYLYVARARQPEFRRLSFVLIGVATPGDLIRDVKRTPFNVGKRVDLTDFTLAEATPLTTGLGLAGAEAEQVLSWVMQWTGGHPYLTQRLCQEMAQVGGTVWTEAEVERLVRRTFLGTQSEQDNNLQFVRDMLTKRAPEPINLLKTYRQIRHSKTPVVDEEQSLVKSHLKLAGVVKREGKTLRVRNRIYRQVFDQRWIKDHLPENWWQHLTPAMRWMLAALLIFSIFMAGLTSYAIQKTVEATHQRAVASLREKAAVVLNMLSTRKAVDGMVLAVQSMGEVMEQKPEVLDQVLSPVQSSLLAAVQSAKEQNLLKHTAVVASVAFSPDGQTIASGSYDKTVRLWDRQGNPIGQPFQGHTAAVNSVVFSPDGQTIASGSSDKTVRLWDRQGNPIGQPFQGHTAAVNSVAFSPNGQTIASGSYDKMVRLWDRQGNPIGQPFQGHTAAVNSVAFSPNGQTIASGSYDKTVRLWDRQGTPIGQPFQGHTAAVNSVAFSPNGQTIASGSSDSTVRLWNRQGTPIGQPFQGHTTYVWSIAFSPDGQTIASGSADNTVRLWNRQGTPIGQPFQGHTTYVISVAFSPDGKTIASGSYDKTVRLWDRQGTPIGQPFEGHTTYVTSVAFSPDGQTIASGSADNTVRLWDRQGIPIGQPFEGHTTYVTSVAFSPDGQTIASGSADNTVRLWDRQGTSIGQPFDHTAAVTSVAFSLDGQTIASGSGTRVSHANGSADNTVRLWDRQGNPIGQPFQGHTAAVTSVVFSSDSQTIASGSSDKTVRLWDRQGTPIGQPFEGHTAAVSSVVFSPDGQTIASGSSDNTVRLWDRQGTPIGQPFEGHTAAISSVAFSSDGQTIASGSADKTVRLWDRQGTPIGQPFEGHTAAVTSVAFSPDGQTIASGSYDNTVRLWSGAWKVWLQVACNRLRFHPSLQNTKDEAARAAKHTCEQ